MNGSDSFKRCRHCGKMIGIIKKWPFGKIIVDADTKFVFPEPDGEIYIRINGTKMRGTESTRWDDDRVEDEAVWKPHRCHEV